MILTRGCILIRVPYVHDTYAFTYLILLEYKCTCYKWKSVVYTRNISLIHEENYWIGTRNFVISFHKWLKYSELLDFSVIFCVKSEWIGNFVLMLKVKKKNTCSASKLLQSDRQHDMSRAFNGYFKWDQNPEGS